MKRSNNYYYYDNHTKRLKEEDETKIMLCENLHFDAREAYKLLRTNIAFTVAKENSECSVIGVTSSVRGEGKSTTAINLAYTIAQNGNSVLLIDGDMRLPSISSKLGIKSKYGLSDYIVNNVAKSEVIQSYDGMNDFDIMLSGSIPPNPSELLGSDGMKRVIDNLKHEYEFIIIDLPPVNIVSDALTLRDTIDGIICCVRENYSDKRLLVECLKHLEFVEIKLLGFVLTDSQSGSGYYSKGSGPKYRYRKYGVGKYSKYYDTSKNKNA